MSESKKSRGRPRQKPPVVDKFSIQESEEMKSEKPESDLADNKNNEPITEKPVTDIPKHIHVPESAQVEEPNTGSVNEDNVDLSSYDPLDNDPLDQPVIDRGYTKPPVDQSTAFEDIPDDSTKVNLGGNTEPKTDPTKDATGQPKPKIENSSAGDLSSSQKRKEAEKAANTIIFHYCKYVPVPFKKWASFNEKKIEKLAMEDKINLNMQFKTDTVFTVLEYIKDVNSQADKAFEVDSETKESIREPLIEVLMEQNLVLTPTQRLLIAVGSHLGTMAFKAFQISQQNKQVLEHFQKSYEQQKRADTSSDQPNVTYSNDANPSKGTPPSSGGGNKQYSNSTNDSRPQEKAVTMEEIMNDEDQESQDDSNGSGDYNDNPIDNSSNETTDDASESLKTEKKVEDAIIISETHDNPLIKKRGRGRPRKNAVSMEEILDGGGNIKETEE